MFGSWVSKIENSFKKWRCSPLSPSYCLNKQPQLRNCVCLKISICMQLTFDLGHFSLRQSSKRGFCLSLLKLKTHSQQIWRQIKSKSAFIDSQLMSLFGHGSKTITPVENSTLLQAFHKNIFGTLNNPSPGFYSRSLCRVNSKGCEIVQRLNLIGVSLKERTLD